MAKRRQRGGMGGRRSGCSVLAGIRGGDLGLRVCGVLSSAGLYRRRELGGCRCLPGRAETAVKTPLIGAELAARSVRWLRVLCEECAGERYEIRRLEVFGENDRVRALPPLPAPEEDGTQRLVGGNWKLSRAEEVLEGGEELSLPDYDDSEWIPAVVPGTVLTSYIDYGAVPDPNYDDWQFQVSEAYFTADFWYRNHFLIPENKRGRRVFLNFDAINWKADVYFNGTLLKNAVPSRKRSIEGA